MDRKTTEFFHDLRKEKAKRARKRPRTEEIVPDVLIYNVGRFLGVKELGRMMQVSQQFNRVIGNSADLWNRHYESMLDDENQKHLPIGDAVKGYERLRMAKAWAKKGFLRTRAKFRTGWQFRIGKIGSASANLRSAGIRSAEPSNFVGKIGGSEKSANFYK